MCLLHSLLFQGSIIVPGGIQTLLRIRSSQKVFTEEEVSSLTGICLDHLRALAGNHHLGFFMGAAQSASSSAIQAAQAAKERALEVAQSAGANAGRLFTTNDLYIVTALLPRCEH